MKTCSHLKRRKVVMFILRFIKRGVEMGFYAGVESVSRRIYTKNMAKAKKFRILL